MSEPEPEESYGLIDLPMPVFREQFSSFFDDILKTDVKRNIYPIASAPYTYRKLVKTVNTGHGNHVNTLSFADIHRQAKRTHGRDLMIYPSKQATLSAWKMVKILRPDYTERRDKICALIWAAHIGDIKALRKLLSFGVFLDRQLENGNTVLMETLAGQSENRCKCIELLLNAGARINLQNKEGHTLLTATAFLNDMTVLKLIQQLKNINHIVDHKTSLGNTALSIAVSKQHYQMVRFLVTECGANLLVEDNRCMTAACWAQVYCPPMAGFLCLQLGLIKLLHQFASRLNEKLRDLSIRCKQNKGKDGDKELFCVIYGLTIFLLMLQPARKVIINKGILNILSCHPLWDLVLEEEEDIFDGQILQLLPWFVALGCSMLYDETSALDSFIKGGAAQKLVTMLDDIISEYEEDKESRVMVQALFTPLIASGHGRSWLYKVAFDSQYILKHFADEDDYLENNPQAIRMSYTMLMATNFSQYKLKDNYKFFGEAAVKKLCPGPKMTVGEKLRESLAYFEEVKKQARARKAAAIVENYLRFEEEQKQMKEEQLLKSRMRKMKSREKRKLIKQQEKATQVENSPSEEKSKNNPKLKDKKCSNNDVNKEKSVLQVEKNVFLPEKEAEEMYLMKEEIPKNSTPKIQKATSNLAIVWGDEIDNKNRHDTTWRHPPHRRIDKSKAADMTINNLPKSIQYTQDDAKGYYTKSTRETIKRRTRSRRNLKCHKPYSGHIKQKDMVINEDQQIVELCSQQDKQKGPVKNKDQQRIKFCSQNNTQNKDVRIVELVGKTDISESLSSHSSWERDIHKRHSPPSSRTVHKCTASVKEKPLEAWESTPGPESIEGLSFTQYPPLMPTNDFYQQDKKSKSMSRSKRDIPTLANIYQPEKKIHDETDNLSDSNNSVNMEEVAGEINLIISEHTENAKYQESQTQEVSNTSNLLPHESEPFQATTNTSNNDFKEEPQNVNTKPHVQQLITGDLSMMTEPQIIQKSYVQSLLGKAKNNSIPPVDPLLVEQPNVCNMPQVQPLLRDSLNTCSNQLNVHTLLREQHSKLSPGAAGDQVAHEKVFDEAPMLEWIPRSKRWRSMFEHLVSLPAEKRERVGSMTFCFKDETLYIARGSAGTIVSIGLRDDGMEVAVKRMLKSNSRIIKNELHNLRIPELEQENIVRYRDYVEDENFGYLALELCECTLEDYVHQLRHDSTLQTKAKKFVWQMLRGLDVLHKANVLHMDIKPRNVLIDVKGNVKLADFGISHKMDDNQSTVYQSGLSGTKCWRPRESLVCHQAGKRPPYKTKSDVQVAGMVAYWTVTGGLHPYGQDRTTVELAIAKGMPRLRDVQDASLINLMAWMLHPEMDQRKSADECLAHPFFWSDSKRFLFLYKVSQEPEIRDKSRPWEVCRVIDSAGRWLELGDWRSEVDQFFLGPEMSLQNYTSQLSDLLRLMADVEDNFNTIAVHLRALMGDPGNYFLVKFPKVFIVIYEIIRESDLRRRRSLSDFFDAAIYTQA